MSNTQFESIAVLISGKLNSIIGKVNEHTDNKADLAGANFTGPISLNGVYSDVIPTVSDSFDIGTSNKQYNNLFTKNLTVNNLLTLKSSNNDVIFSSKSSDGSTNNAITILDGGQVMINESYKLPQNDGELGQVFATDGNGNIIFKTLENESSDFAQYIINHDFTGDGITDTYTVNATTLNKVIYVEVNGLIQKEGINFTVNDKTISFNEPVKEGSVGTILFWGNDITSVISSKDFSGDGTSFTFTTDTNLNKPVLVEVNGLIQKQGIDYTVNSSTNSIIFTEPIPNGSTGTIVYV